ncbi:MAG: winged helix-turn-helix transcriptional regulator [Deltaproteobacteria bacterium]|nr:winged helix-turn-helix transcriptional regulator [Deltaproteobacteria bacterium]
MKIRNKEIFDLHADLCKTLSSPKRLMIIALLAKKELSVGELAEVLEVPIANVSQHLRTLKDNFVVKARKNGQIVYYSLVDPRMVEACNILRSVLLEKMKARGKVARNINPEELIDE